jgi:hypothetical protein
MDNNEARDTLAGLADTITEKLGRLQYTSQQLVVHSDDWLFALGELEIMGEAVKLATDIAVGQARDAGRSWSQIGSVLGVTKQRFGGAK